MTKSLRNIEASINEDDPFIDCKLDRKKYAENLASIIRNYPTGFVLALNNRWGDGKTFFVNRWRQLLKKEEFQTIYYNAWKDDFADNALLSIIAELTEDIEKPDEKLLETLLEKGTTLFASSLPIILKAAVKKGLGKDGFEEIAELIGDQVGGSFTKLIDEHKKQKKTIVDFKEALRAFALEAGKGKPLLFFIDELDRCKPSFAVEVLEVIKHFFDVDNIVFVLSIDKEQLANSVKGYYGSDKIDGNEYLKRFIDLEYSLPKPELGGFFEQQYLKLDFKVALQGDRLRYRELQDDNNHFTFLINGFFEDKDLNLREIERIMAKTRLVMYSFSVNDYMWPSLLTILVYLSDEMPNEFGRIKRKEMTLEEILRLNMNILDCSRYSDRKRLPNGLLLHEFAFFSLYKNYAFERMPVESEESFKEKYSKVSFNVDRLYDLSSGKRFELPELDRSLNLLIKKIELAQNLTINI